MTLNEQIQQILDEENAQLEQRSWLKRVWKSENRKQALKAEFIAFWRGLSKKGIFTLFLIIAFVFMLTFSVL
ncbi:MAG: hypothetical protein PHC99_12555 [Methylococcales bacterium]|nr:hypothetical protein [Methylococcales bacterium]